MPNLMRAMRILEWLADEPEGLRVTDIASRMNMNRAIPYRILNELLSLGYVIQDEVAGCYRATFLLGSLGLRQLDSAGIQRWSQDELDRLATVSGELVRVSIATNNRLRFVAQAQGASSSLVLNSPLRAELFLHATASGKAYLSTLPPEEVASILRDRGLESFTPSTVTSVEEMSRQMAQIKEQGFALVQEEFELGVSAIAAPIVPAQSRGTRAVGAVSIAGPSARLGGARMQELAPFLRATAEQLAKHWHVYEYLESLVSSGTREQVRVEALGTSAAGVDPAFVS